MLDSKVIFKKNSLTVQVLVGGFCGKNNLFPHGSAFLSRDHKDTTSNFHCHQMFLLPKKTKNFLLLNPFTCLYISTYFSLFIFSDTTYYCLCF